MNEKINTESWKWSPEDEKFVNELVGDLLDEYKRTGEEIKFEINANQIIYIKKDGNKIMFPRWRKVRRKDKEDIDLKDLIKEAIDRDLEN